MRSNDKNETVARIAARGVMLTALLAMTFVGAGIDRVQAGAAQSSTPAASATQSPARGAHEGIGVHGHWTIDVKNPNGSLARHVEFENGLCIGSGDRLLAQMLGGGGLVGGWEIKLGNPAIPAGTAGPACGGVLDLGGSLLYMLEQNNDASSNSGACAGVNVSFPTIFCFATLNPPTIGGTALSLSGQFTVPTAAGSTQITAVGTEVSFCAVTTVSSSQCLTGSGGVGGASTDFTGAYLTGVAPMPAAITVVAGQSVSVNVQLSFH
jgi:hypothetical protein